MLIINGGDSITDISYTPNSFVGTPDRMSPPTPTIKPLAQNTFSISLETVLPLSPDVAQEFVKVCGGTPANILPTLPLKTGGMPLSMEVFFEIVVNFKTPAGTATANLFLGHGLVGNGVDWWIGGNCVTITAAGKASIQVTVGDNGKPFTLRLSGALSLFEFSETYPIKHVFVLMLENHSFDCMFAMSGIDGITAATTNNSNSFLNGTKYNVTKGAPTTMPADPGHNFPDVLKQLAGPGASYPKNGPYPPINNSGFVTDFATKTSEPNFGAIMAAFDTPTQLQVIYQLATEYTLCDHWFSSLPGPTWPNRFFVHGASSAGLDDSPNPAFLYEGAWEYFDGFEYPNGSIYDAMNNSNIAWKIYNDSVPVKVTQFVNRQQEIVTYKWSQFSNDQSYGESFGAIPQVCALKGIRVSDARSLENFSADLIANYPYAYTFIEPHWGAVSGNYAGGSSQHPMDDVYGGENLIKYVYESIRNFPLWETSLLIITYDEHGGFYDSVAPGTCPAPNDNNSTSGEKIYKKHNTCGFNFEQYGVRVPAVIVSPWVAAQVDSTVYDHSSVLATVEKLFGLSPLTKRDEKANNLTHLFSQAPRPDSDCPRTLVNPAPATVKTALTSEEIAVIESQPIPTEGNFPGFLAIMLKTELELSSGTEEERKAIIEKYQNLKTIGDAKAQHAIMMDKVAQAKAAKT